MNWTRTLGKPIALKDGRMIGTLAAALALMLSLPNFTQRQAVWRDVGELLAEAETSETWLPDVRSQLSMALMAEGLI